MEPDSAKFLWDALRAVDAVSRMARGADFDKYRADEMLRSAIERQLEFVGEALSRLRRIDPTQPPAFRISLGPSPCATS